jgi:glycosyltransferase involved in cell wall biosynthesis
MKVALVASARSWHTYRWYKSLRERCEVRVFTFNRGTDLYGDGQIVFESRLPQKLRYMLGLGKIRQSVHGFKPDILHAHYATGHGYLGYKLGLHPFVVSVWGSDIFDFPYKSSYSRNLVRKVLDKADAICATSQRLRDGTLKLYPELESKINVIPFGIDMDLFRPDRSKKKEGAIIIGTAKLLREIYQIDILMKIFDRIAEDNPNIGLKIAGDGPQEDELLGLKENLRHGNRIEFVGKIENDSMPEFLNQLDIFVLPSRFESFGVSALEASACQLPVVAFDVGGLSEILRHDVSAFLVPEGNIDKFEEAIRTLVEDEKKRFEMGLAGREIVSHKYDVEKTTEMQLDLYKSLN